MLITPCSLTEWLCSRRLLGVMLSGRQWRCILSKFQVEIVQPQQGVKADITLLKHEYVFWGMKAAQCLDAPVSLTQSV